MSLFWKSPMMPKFKKQIKTLTETDVERFDQELLKYLNDGWSVVGGIRSAVTWISNFNENEKQTEITHYATLMTYITDGN